MINNYEIWAPKTTAIIWRILGLFLLSLLWLRSHGSEMGVVLLLFLSIMALIRWRFNIPQWSVIIDQIACLSIIPFWPNGSYGLALPIFETMINGKPVYILPALMGILYYWQTSFPLAVVSLQAALSGWVIQGWSKETNIYRQEADVERRDRYELENLKGELLEANIQVARMAEISERNRIAQQLHDDVGHEITAAVLAFQAFEQLWKEDDPLAKEMFDQGKKRLTNSALYLRETVHNLKPVKAIGIDGLQEICNGFINCPIDFRVYGDTSKVPAYLWNVLNPCLKEALTNVARHARATQVSISLDINPSIVRLSIHDDGLGSRDWGSGVGIRNLRQRARSVGGNISIDTTSGFKLICVLPMEKDHK